MSSEANSAISIELLINSNKKKYNNINHSSNIINIEIDNNDNNKSNNHFEGESKCEFDVKKNFILFGV